MSPIELLRCGALFTLITVGVGWPFVRHARLDAAEKFAATCIVSLVIVWLVAWAIYVFALPLPLFWILPVVAVANLVWGRAEFLIAARDPCARQIAIGYVLLSAWCVGWLAFVLTYSGGGWSADWFEHWERVRFFHDHWARDHRFLAFYPLAARPPLANVVTVAFIGVTGRDFAHFQVISALLATLAFVPAALLIRRFGRTPAAIAVLTLVLMLNPMVLQNATFTWTKLPTVFFVLSALYFFVRAQDADAPASTTWLVAFSLTAGLLAHYSAGPYAVLLGIAWIVIGWRSNRSRGWWVTTMAAAIAAGLLLATWFGWSIAVYGSRETFLSNTSVTAADAESGHQLSRILLNLRDTIVPHFLRHPDPSVVAQSNKWGTIRDWFFQAYQVNLLFITGSVAWLVILRELWRAAGAATPANRWFWSLFVTGSIVLGVAVHGARDEWGLAHICLLPIGVLGLAFIAARWPLLSRPWRLATAAGLCVDGVAGIALHFAVENYALDRWFPDGRPFDRIMLSYTRGGQVNIVVKAQQRLVFFGDSFPVPPSVTIIGLTLILGLAIWCATHSLRAAAEPSR